jgi:hypothetical protein
MNTAAWRSIWQVIMTSQIAQIQTVTPASWDASFIEPAESRRKRMLRLSHQRFLLQQHVQAGHYHRLPQH